MVFMPLVFTKVHRRKVFNEHNVYYVSVSNEKNIGISVISSPIPTAISTVSENELNLSKPPKVKATF